PPFISFISIAIETLGLAANIGISRLPARRNCDFRPFLRPPAPLRQPGFDGIPDTLLQPDPVESVDFLQARGGSHIDLRHVIANDVDPDENQAPFLEGRTYRGTDVLFPGRKLRTLRFAPGMHIGAGLASRRYPVYGAGGLAIDQDDALVPLA